MRPSAAYRFRVLVDALALAEDQQGLSLGRLAAQVDVTPEFLWSCLSHAVDVELEDAGDGASAIVYYGEKDCLTYAPRKTHGTEKKSSVLTADNTWSSSARIAAVKTGRNIVKLENLKPGTTYYYRVLVTNERGKTWTFETHEFKTR